MYICQGKRAENLQKVHICKVKNSKRLFYVPLRLKKTSLNVYKRYLYASYY